MKNWENETNCTTIIAMKLLAMSIHGVLSGAIMNNSKKNWTSVWVITTNRLYTGFKKTYKWVHCSINYRKEHWNWEIKDLHQNFFLMVSLIGCAVSYKRRKPIVSIDIMTNKSNVVYFVAKSIICGLTSFQMWKQINRACV